MEITFTFYFCKTVLGCNLLPWTTHCSVSEQATATKEQYSEVQHSFWASAYKLVLNYTRSSICLFPSLTSLYLHYVAGSKHAILYRPIVVLMFSTELQMKLRLLFATTKLQSIQFEFLLLSSVYALLGYIYVSAWGKAYERSYTIPYLYVYSRDGRKIQTGLFLYDCVQLHMTPVSWKRSS